MKWLLDQIFGARLNQETDLYLRSLAYAPAAAARHEAAKLLGSLSTNSGPKLNFGEAEWGDKVLVPVADIARAYGLVTGGTGAGKTMFILGILKALVDMMPSDDVPAFAILDPKGELFQGALFLIAKRLEALARQDPAAHEALRQRIVIYDFASRDPVSSYNILARWPNAEADFFASNRADLLLDLLPGQDKLSLGGAGLLQKLLLLLSEFNLPVTYLNEVLHDEQLRRRLVAASSNGMVKSYFAHQFAGEPKPTIAAISRRMDALFASEGVRLALAGDTAPDFRRFQDEGAIVLVNCFGENISRSVRHLLQALVLSDIRHSVFSRRRKERAYLWFCDEAQNFFLTERLREHMSDLLTMSRSFGTYFAYLTQNIGTAVPDSRVLRTLHTNIRWSLSLRGDPADCQFLKPVLPVTGRKVRPRGNPFEEESFYTLAEERAMALDEIAQLPDRTGWLWLRARSAGAIKIRTRDLTIPAGPDLEEATLSSRSDATIGRRLSRAAYDQLIEDRDRRWRDEEAGDLGNKLAESYERLRRGPAA